MRTAALALLLVLAVLSGCATEEDRSAVALERELQLVCAGQEFWPGYDPLAVPLAVFDGTNTFLFRHPAPPEGFVEREGVRVFDGRHEAVVANSSVWIGDVATATIMLESLPAEQDLGERAALVVHEGFHVFQGTTGRRWGANEVDLFTYPTDDSRLLVLRRLETEALRRAFLGSGRDTVAGWAIRALELRQERFAGMDPASQAYEQGVETHEGTATYVEYKAAGRTDPRLPPDGFDAEDVRSRAYTTGVAWALLLDAFSPGWQQGLCSDDSLHLDISLAKALAAAHASPRRCRFTASERSAAARLAQTDVELVRERRVERRAQFDSSPGWRVVVEADEASPLWPQGFDPLNVQLVDGGILHTRFLKLGNEHGALELMGGTAFTQAAGAHPLFNGIRRVTLTGLETEPEVEIQGERVIVNAPGFKADLTRARLERDGAQITVRLAPRE